MGPRAGVNGRVKFRPNRDSIPVLFSPYQIPIPTELSRPIFGFTFRLNLVSCFILCVINYYEKKFSFKNPQMYKFSSCNISSCLAYHILKLR